MLFFARFRKHYLPMFMTYVVISAVILLVAGLYRDPESTTFWRNIAWIEILLFVLWLPFLYWSHPSLGRVTSRQAAILPSVTLVIVAYVIVAGCTLLFNIFVHDLGSVGIAIQVIAAGIALVAGLALQSAMAQGEAGAEPFPEKGSQGIYSPSTLAQRLRAAEATVPPDMAVLSRAYALLRDDLANRLPGAGGIGINEEYANLSRRIIAELDTPPPADLEEAQARASVIYAMRADIGMLVLRLRR